MRRSRVASGRQQNRTGAYGEVPSPPDTCSHEDVSLSFGCIKDGAIKCGYHGSRFCLKTGRALNEPATEAIPVYSTRIDGDTISVALENPS